MSVNLAGANMIRCVEGGEASMRGLDARTGELFSYVDLEDRVPAQHRSRRIIKPTAFFPCRAAWEAHSPSIPSVLPPPRAPPKKTSNTGHASSAVWGPFWGSHPIVYSAA